MYWKEDKYRNEQLHNKEEKVEHSNDEIDDKVWKYKKNNVDYLHIRLLMMAICQQDQNVENVSNQLVWLWSEEIVAKVGKQYTKNKVEEMKSERKTKVKVTIESIHNSTVVEFVKT